MFKKILLATDGSSDAGQALIYARDLALRDGAQVIVVYAFDPVPSYLGDPWRDKVVARHAWVGQEVADKAEQHFKKAGIDVIVEVLEGPPANAILKVAEVRECDLIVMGSLRLWRVDTERGPVWRASLQSADGSERQAFGDLARLSAFLAARTRQEEGPITHLQYFEEE